MQRRVGTRMRKMTTLVNADCGDMTNDICPWLKFSLLRIWNCCINRAAPKPPENTTITRNSKAAEAPNEDKVDRRGCSHIARRQTTVAKALMQARLERAL